ALPRNAHSTPSREGAARCTSHSPSTTTSVIVCRSSYVIGDVIAFEPHEIVRVASAAGSGATDARRSIDQASATTAAAPSQGTANIAHGDAPKILNSPAVSSGSTMVW